ncbi:MAG: restriction endonuclease subunit S [Desulfobulbaceae bacterium]|nr:restriction endonuclease subunit S [Desulfobulbaceae bacterium]
MKKVPISSIANVTAGQGAPKPDEFSESGIPFVRAGSLEALLAGKSEADLELVPTEIAKKRKLKLYPKGSILFAKSGMSATKDRIYVLQNPAYVVSHLAILTTKDNVHRHYLRLALKQFPPSSLIKDLAYPAIGLGEIQGYEIPVPEEIDDQKRIAHLLGKVEGLIARRKQQLQQLDDLLKNVFLEIFGNPVRNEKGWKTIPLSGLGDWKSGGTPARNNPEFYTGNIPWVSSGELNELYISDSAEKISQEAIFHSAAKIIEPFSLLLGMYDTAALKSSINTNRMSCNQAIAYSILDKSKCNVLFVYWYIQIGKNYFKSKRRGVRQKNLNLSMVKSIPVFEAPINLQNQFATIVDKVESIKSRYRINLTDFELLYGALSQKAFKGELDLSRIILNAERTESMKREIPESGDNKTMNLVNEQHAIENLAKSYTQGDRIRLLEKWINKWIENPVNSALPSQKFMDALKQKLSELLVDESPEWIEEYEYLKSRVFEALQDGRMTQTLNKSKNRIEIKPVSK